MEKSCIGHGPESRGHDTVKLQGAIFQRIGGDASSAGPLAPFYDGAMAAAYTTDAADDGAVHVNIVAATVAPQNESISREWAVMYVQN